MKGLTDVPGILVGHATDSVALTGCTVDSMRTEAVGGVDMRGSATGSCETRYAATRAMWRPTFMRSCLPAAARSGWKPPAASAICWKSEASDLIPASRSVPIVPGAILFDLGIGKPMCGPTREMGEKAAMAANDGPVAEGNVGAGTGRHGGQDFRHEAGDEERDRQRVAYAGFGRDGGRAGGGECAGGCDRSGERADCGGRAEVAGQPGVREFGGGDAAWLGSARSGGEYDAGGGGDECASGSRADQQTGGAGESRGRAHDFAGQYDGDGDITFAISLGKERASVDEVGVAAAEALAKAVLRAVRAAKSAGGVPGLAG